VLGDNGDFAWRTNFHVVPEDYRSDGMKKKEE